MVRKSPFTIIELLVAITITVVAVNLLSSIYVRATSLAIAQTEVQATTRDGIAALDVIQRELRNLIVPIADDWDTSSNEASSVEFPIFIGDIREDGETDSYRGIIFHRQRTTYETGSSSTAMGLEEVALFVAPPVNGFGDYPYLNLYRIINQDYNETTGTFNDSLFDGVNHVNPNDIDAVVYGGKESILEGVVGITFDAKFYDVGGDSYSHITEFDPSELARDESHNLESIRVSITIAPPAHQMKIRPRNIPLSDYNDPGEYARLEGNNIDIDDYILESGFFFQGEGFFANLNTGQVFQYTRPSGSDSAINVSKVMDNACGDSGDSLVTGFSFQRYFTIR